MPLLMPCLFSGSAGGRCCPDCCPKALCCPCLLMAETYALMIGEEVTAASCRGPRCYDGTIHNCCVDQARLARPPPTARER